MEGITGLNPVEAKKQINDVLCHGLSIVMDLENSVNSYYMILNKIWFSPQAVSFSMDIFPELVNCYIDICNAYWKICDSAQDAYNKVAAAHGIETINDFEDTGAEEHVTISNHILKEVSDNGIVGMNKKEVEEITTLFLNHLENDIIKSLEETPLNISLFDPNGSQQAAFRDIIKNLVESLKTLINDISTKLKNCVDDDTNRIELSARQSAEVLGGRIS